MTNSLFEELLRSHGHYLQMGDLNKHAAVRTTHIICKITLLLKYNILRNNLWCFKGESKTSLLA